MAARYRYDLIGESAQSPLQLLFVNPSLAALPEALKDSGHRYFSLSLLSTSNMANGARVVTLKRSPVL